MGSGLRNGGKKVSIESWVLYWSKHFGGNIGNQHDTENLRGYGGDKLGNSLDIVSTGNLIWVLPGNLKYFFRFAHKWAGDVRFDSVAFWTLFLVTKPNKCPWCITAMTGWSTPLKHRDSIGMTIPGWKWNRSRNYKSDYIGSSSTADRKWWKPDNVPRDGNHKSPHIK